MISRTTDGNPTTTAFETGTHAETVHVMDRSSGALCRGDKP